jgi:acetyl esterase/lipase
MKPVLLVLAFAHAVSALEPVTIPLWPAGAPEITPAKIGPEQEPDRADGIRRLTNVTVPTITIHRPAAANGTAVVVCPGGGYRILAIEHEGTKVCEFLNTLGVTSVLLKYRVPARDPADPGREALQDAQRAMGILRHRAAEFGIRPDRIGMLGFSAGGHLTVMTCLQANARTYPQDPALDSPDRFIRPTLSAKKIRSRCVRKSKSPPPRRRSA